MKNVLFFLFSILFSLETLQAQNKYKDIFDVFAQEDVTAYVRSEKRVLKFTPDQDVYSIISSIKEKFQDADFLEKEIQKGGMELYINAQILSQLQITRQKVISLQAYFSTLEPSTMSQEDVSELIEFLERFISETDKTKKETYKRKALAKALQMKLQEEGIDLELSKIKVIPVDIEKIIDDAKAEVELARNKEVQLTEDFTLEDFYHLNSDKGKLSIYTEFLKYHFKRLFRTSKEDLSLSSIYVKPNRKNSTRNLLLKAPGAAGSLIGSTIELASNPIAAFLTGTFSMALNVFHSVYATTIMNFHDRLANWNKVGQIVFEFAYGRAIEMVVYRLPLWVTQNIKFFDGALGVKVLLNSTIGAWLGTMGYKGWNRLVQKGVLTREQAGTYQETAMNAFLFSQLSTGFSGDPFWDIAYAVSFGISQVIDLGVWFFSRVKNAKTKIVMIALGKDFKTLSNGSLERFRNGLKTSFAQDHGFVLSESKDDLFLKVPTLKQSKVKTKNMFLEYNLKLAEKYLDKALEVLKNGKNLKDIYVKIPMQEYSESEYYDNSENLMSLKNVLFKEKIGLFSVLYQNIKEIVKIDIIASFKAKGLGTIVDLLNANQLNIVSRHYELHEANVTAAQEFDNLLFKYIDITKKLLAVANLYELSPEFYDLEDGFDITIDKIRKKKIYNVSQVLLNSMGITTGSKCATELSVLNTIFN